MKYGLLMPSGTSEACRTDPRAAFAKSAEQIVGRAAGTADATP
jgi:hypothetical protein